MLDHYVTGEVERISPEAPVPVVRVESEHRALGGAANVAAGVRALGAACRLVGVVGEDGPGDELRSLLRASEISDDDLRTDPSRPTTRKTRVLARHQQMLRIDRELSDPVGSAVRKRLREATLGALDWADVLVLVDYDKGTLWSGFAEPILERAREKEVVSIVDPKLRNFFEYRDAFLFKPNGAELAAARGTERPPREREALQAVRERLGCRHLLVTLGEQGMLLLGEDDTEVRTIPSEAREVYDVSGAGDTVTAVLAATLAGRATVFEGARLANFAAGLEVSRLGAVPVAADELLEALRDSRERENA